MTSIDILGTKSHISLTLDDGVFSSRASKSFDNFFMRAIFHALHLPAAVTFEERLK
jgi:hypothetical protein